jgi:hypothetical protein
MGDHHVVVVALTALTLVLWRAVRPEMHSSGVVPQEERRAVLVCLVDEVQRVVCDLFIDCLHAFFRQRTGVFDPLASIAVRPTVQDAARTKPLLECRALGIVRILRLLLGVEVV